MNADEGDRWGWFNALVESDELLAHAQTVAARLAAGPTVAHGVTKAQLNAEWDMSIDDAIEAEAVAQARCMETADFNRAYEAFAKKERPEFKGN